MDVERHTERRSRRRWTVRTLMLLVAICAVVCLMIRPDKPSAEQLGLKLARQSWPGIDFDRYDSSVVGLSPDAEYWVVQFLENNPGAAKRNAFKVAIPVWRVQEAAERSTSRGRLPWNAPNLSPESKTRSPYLFRPEIIPTPPPAVPGSTGKSP